MFLNLFYKDEKDSNESYDLVKAFGPGGSWSEVKGGVFAPEEVFFATMLSILGYIRDDKKGLKMLHF